MVRQETTAKDTMMTEQDPRWQAVVARDRAADGRFVYSVRTTGVYCRPSCGARRPRPENVAFHADCAAAEQAGFRPCRRCRPDQADAQAALVTRLCRLIEQAERVPELAELAAVGGLSPSRLHRLFRERTGVTPRAYAVALRARRLQEELAQPQNSVTDSLYAAGYGSSGRLYEAAPQVLGMTPTAFRGGGARAIIHFAVGQCTLGAVLVARSERGVCAILMGDDPEPLVRDLQDRFPKAELIGGDPGFEHLIAAVIAAADNPKAGLDLPLDIRGTAFQQRVWQELRHIPPGHTASYSDIAARIGRPDAVRAVAGACAANAHAIAIPCHRVVRTDGALSGYRWGIERKRTLLTREGAR